MSSFHLSLMATISNDYFDMESYEGKELRKSVLIRNAVKASTSSTIIEESGSGGSSIHKDVAQQQREQLKERWLVMAAQSGLHPCIFSSEDLNVQDEDEDEDDEVILLEQQVQIRDYYEVAIQVEQKDDDDEDLDKEQEQDENKWFDGLLQEVRVDQSRILEDDEDRQMSMSSTPSLPSLIMDEYDDTSEEDEGEEASKQVITKTLHHPHKSSTHSAHTPIF